MNASMINQLEFSRERCSAIGANKWIQRAVETRMHDQMIFLGKTFAAFIANVRTFASMEFTVCNQVTFQRKRAATFLTYKWSFTTIKTKNEKRNIEKNMESVSKITGNHQTIAANELKELQTFKIA